jgi:ribonuclease J
MKLNLQEYKDDFLLIPLGGTDEIGINLYLYQYQGKWLIVDMGLGFADERYPGIDLVLPDISMLAPIRKNILAIVVTHAHEDHMGAIPYLWEELGLPIYATAFATKVIKSKLVDQGLADKVEMREIIPGGRIDLGPFNLEFIPLTHSVPQMQGIVITTEIGRVFHSGDWKFDDAPIIEAATCKKKLKEIGDSEILAMVCDSTNIFSEGRSGSEGELRKSLESLVCGYDDRLIIVTTFASNIARIDSLMAAAQKAGRKVILSGTSLWRMYDAATECGYLQDYERPLHPKNFGKHKRKDLLVIATGCQGEKLASMNKMATGTHQDIQLKKNDVVIFSSKIIPGNENKIYSVFGNFYKIGVQLLTERDHFVHVSGHPCRDELEEMYKLIRPKFAIPMHGQPMHTHEHCDFIKKKKLSKPLQIQNGSVVALSPDSAEVIGHVDTGYLAVDGNFVVPAESEILRMRRRMRDHGLVSISMVYGGKKIASRVSIIAPGVLDSQEDGELFRALQGQISDYLQNVNLSNVKDAESKIKAISKRFFKHEIGKDPQIFVQLLKLMD